MHTVKVIVGGLLLLAVFLLIGRWIAGSGSSAMANAAKYFVPFWLACALVNMWFGVNRAGYSVGEETPIFIIIFAVPTVIALALWWRLSQG